MKIIFHNSHGGFVPTSDALRKQGMPKRALPDERKTSSHSLQSTASTPTEGPLSDSEAPQQLSPHSQQLVLQPQPQQRRRRKQLHAVHFDEQTNVLHENKPLDRQEVNELWYSRIEFNRFRRETMQEAQATVYAERKLPEDENTSAVLHGTYQRFCTVQTSADLMAVLTNTNSQFHIPVYFIGLDRWTINSLLQDKVERRRRILRQVQEIQRKFPGNHEDAVNVRQGLIRQVSRTISQPSRLYAHHVAQLAARVGT